MKFSDIFKKGYGTPAQSDLLEGGIGVDVQNKKLFSKGTDGNIFQVGLTDAEITAISDFQTAITEALEKAQPSGMISMWSGSITTIPEDWALCDGSNGTPDLRNRSIIAAGDEFAVDATGDGTIPVHTHTVAHEHTASSSTDGSHSHSASSRAAFDESGGAVFGNSNSTTNPLTLYTGSSGSHNHTITVAEATPTTSENGTGTVVVPKHYALAYIMKL